MHDVARLLAEMMRPNKATRYIGADAALHNAVHQLGRLIALTLLPLRLLAELVRRVWSRPSGLLRGASLKDVSATGASDSVARC